MYIEAGGVRMPGNPIKLSGYDDPAVRVGAPELDQHGAALRHELAPAGIEILQSWLKNNWPDQSVDMSKNVETADVKREKRASTQLAAE